MLFEKGRYPDSLSFLSAAKHHLDAFEADSHGAATAASRALPGSLWRLPGSILSAMLHNCKGVVHNAVGSHEASIEVFVTSAEALSTMDPSEIDYILPPDLETAWIDMMAVTLHNLSVTHLHLADEPAAVHAIMRAVDVARHKSTIREIPELVEQLNETLNQATLALDQTLEASGTGHSPLNNSSIQKRSEPRVAPLALLPPRASSPEEKKIFLRPPSILQKLAGSPKKKESPGAGKPVSVSQTQPVKQRAVKVDFKVPPGMQGPRSPPSSSESSPEQSPQRSRVHPRNNEDATRGHMPRRAQSALDSVAAEEWEESGVDFTWETLAFQASSPRQGLNKLRSALLGEIDPFKKKQAYRRSLTSPLVPYENLAPTAWSAKKPQRIVVTSTHAKRSRILPALNPSRVQTPFQSQPLTVAEQAMKHSAHITKPKLLGTQMGHRGPGGVEASPYAKGKAAASRSLGLAKLEANSAFTKSILNFETDFSRSKSLREQIVRSQSPPQMRHEDVSESDEEEWEVDEEGGEEHRVTRDPSHPLPRALRYLKQFCWTDQNHK